MKKPKVSVIVLNWNGIAYTTKCLAALRKQTFKDFEIIVVDNGSTDSSIQTLSKIKDIKLVRNKKNLGFAEGNNVGVRHSTASTYIALLNNDTQADKNWLKELVKAMDSNPKLGEAMSQVNNRYSASDFREEPDGTSTMMLFLTKYDFKVDTSKPVPVFSASGGAMIYRKELRTVPFDKDYFIYNEDGWLGWLLRLRGYHVAEIPSSIVYHEGEATIKKNKKMRGYFIFLGERNRILNLLQCYSVSNLIKLAPIFFTTLLMLNISSPSLLPHRLRAYWWLLTNPHTILKKRKYVQSQRTTPDSKITRYLSAKLFEPSYFKGVAGSIIKLLNAFSIGYCKLLRIPSVERP